MPGWTTSNRKQQLPSNWQTLRVFVLERDKYQCQHLDANTVDIDPVTGKQTGEICGRKANQVDHKVPGPDHTTENLQALCEYHHNKKSSSEGGKAKAAKEAALRESQKPKHPGYKRQA